MTTIDRDRLAMWRQTAIDAGDDPYANTLHPDEVVALLDALTRAEARSETRRQQTKYWQARAEGFEARIADTLALCDEWAAMGTRSMNIGAVRRALGGVAGESTALARAEARIQAVRDVHRRFGIYEHEDACTSTTDEHREEHHHEDSDSSGEYYCDQMPISAVCDHCRDEDGERADWPCPTIRALDAP